MSNVNGGRSNGMSAMLLPLWRSHWGIQDALRAPLVVLLGACALVLLIVCANMATLLLTRATARRRELALRMALGAPRRRLLRQLLTEASILAIAGASLGLLCTFWLARSLRLFVPQFAAPSLVDPHVDVAVVVFTIAPRRCGDADRRASRRRCTDRASGTTTRCAMASRLSADTHATQSAPRFRGRRDGARRHGVHRARGCSTTASAGRASVSPGFTTDGVGHGIGQPNACRIRLGARRQFPRARDGSDRTRAGRHLRQLHGLRAAEPWRRAPGKICRSRAMPRRRTRT